MQVSVQQGSGSPRRGSGFSRANAIHQVTDRVSGPRAARTQRRGRAVAGRQASLWSALRSVLTGRRIAMVAVAVLGLWLLLGLLQAEFVHTFRMLSVR